MAGTNWYVSYCKDCLNMNLNDRWYLDKSKAWCSARREYYNPNDRACSNHFQNDEYRNPSNTGCYLTTIVCDNLGYADDCKVLNTLRDFRENIMKKNEKYQSLLYEYDIVGPMIADNIRNSLKPIDLSKFLYESYILNVEKAIEEEKYDLAVIIYSYMVGKLKQAFGMENIEIPYEKQATGKGYLKDLGFQNQK
jgi:hypothetical protein